MFMCPPAAHFKRMQNMPLWMRTEKHNFFCPHAQLAKTKQVQPAAAKSIQYHPTARDLQVQEEALTGATK